LKFNEGGVMQTDVKPPENLGGSNPSDITIPCPVCREPIKEGARKCVHCDSVLDWRGWLGISETALALLVALVSVIGATGPRVVELLTPRSSDLKLSLRQVWGQNLELVGLNQGHRNSQLLSASIWAKTQDGRQLDAIPLQITGIPNVPGEQATLFELQIPPASIPAFLSWPHPKIQSAALAAVVNEYKKQPEIRNIDVPVGYFRLFCRATEDYDTIMRHPGLPLDARLASRCVAP